MLGWLKQLTSVVLIFRFFLIPLSAHSKFTCHFIYKVKIIICWFLQVAEFLYVSGNYKGKLRGDSVSPAAVHLKCRLAARGATETRALEHSTYLALTLCQSIHLVWAAPHHLPSAISCHLQQKWIWSSVLMSYLILLAEYGWKKDNVKSFIKGKRSEKLYLIIHTSSSNRY